MTAEPWSAWLSTPDVYQLHERALREHGGLEGVRDDGCVPGALGSAWNAQAYESGNDDGAPDLFLFVVRLFLYLLRNHCFNDGNKRVAWLAMETVLRQQGLTIGSSDDDAETFVRSATENSFPFSEVVDFFSDRIEAVNPEDR